MLIMRKTKIKYPWTSLITSKIRIFSDGIVHISFFKALLINEGETTHGANGIRGETTRIPFWGTTESFYMACWIPISIRGVARHVNECRHKVYGERSGGHFRPPAGPGQFSYLWGTLKYNDTNKIVKFVIISTLKQNVCLLPSRIFITGTLLMDIFF